MDDKFSLPPSNINNANIQLDPIKETENKSPIGQGRSLADLKKLAQASVVKNDIPNVTKSPVIAASSNPIPPPQVNHADNLINLLKSNFSNSRERVIAENKIRRYFDGFYNV